MKLWRIAALGMMLTGPCWAQTLPPRPPTAPLADATGWRHPDPHVWELAANAAAWSRVWRRVDAQDWALRRIDPAHT